MISDSRCTAHIRNFILTRLYISARLRPIIGESSGILCSTSSTLPFWKSSTFAAVGRMRILEISSAVVNSGLITIERPISSLIRSICLKYSGFLTLEIALLVPSFLASRQQSIFSSSKGVVAIRSPALLAPASISTSTVAPFPSTHITS